MRPKGYPKSRLFRASLAGCTVSLGALVHAQQSPAPATPNPAEEKVIALSPFQVTTDADSGYVATNTLAGSRLNTSLLDTPASISVMTKEFLDDIGALDLTKAMEYAVNGGNDIGGGGANSGAVTGNGLIENAFNFQIRGYRGATVTRNYFNTILNGDSFNMERVDIARGPNSILFGIGGPGGIVNISPKLARTDRPFGSVYVVGGSWNLRRASVDVNQPLFHNTLAARANIMVQDADGYQDFESDNQRRGALDVVWRPFKSTSVRLNGEVGHLHQNRVRPWAPWDLVENWKNWGSHTVAFGTPQSPSVAGDDNYSQWVLNAAGTNAYTDPNTGWPEVRTAGNIVQQNVIVALMDGPLGGRVLYTGSSADRTRYYRTSSSENVSGYNNALPFEDESIFPRTGNITGPGAFVETDYATYGLTLEQRIGRNLHVEVAANRTETRILQQTPLPFSGISIFYDVTTTLPTFTANGLYDGTIGGPNTGAFGQAFANRLGIPYVNSTQGYNALNLNRSIDNPYVGQLMAYADPSYSKRDATRDDLRVSANYRLDLGKFGDHMLLAFVSRTETETEGMGYAFANVHPQRNSVNMFTNKPRLAYHIDAFSPNLADRGLPDVFAPGALPSSQSILGIPGWYFEGGYARNSWTWSRNRIDSGTLAAQSRFFKNHVILTGGARRDTIQIWNSTQTNVNTGETMAVNRNAATSVDETGDTYTVGAVVRMPAFEWISAFANVSTNFKDQGGAQRLEDEALRPGREIGPLKGKGRDFGLKFSLLDRKLNATVTRFEVEQDNQVFSHQGNVNSYIGAIWTTLLNGGPVTSLTDAQDPNGHRIGGSDTRSQMAEGYELEITANPTPNWRVSFNVSKSTNALSNLGSALEAYLDKHRATWQAASALNYDTGRAPGNVFNAGGSNTIGALVYGLDKLLAFVKAQEGQIETNIRPWNANAFTAYNFSRGRLKGLTLGVGANYRGDAILGVKPGTVDAPEIQTFKGGDYFLFNGMAAYELALKGKLKVRFQLNVENLLDNQDKQVLASSWNPLSSSLETYTYFFRPRSYKLSATFRF